MKVISLNLILILSLGGLVFAQGDTGRVNQKLRRELSVMLEDDQRYRKAVAEVERSTLAPDEKEKRVAVLDEKQEKADKRNVKKLAKIIEKYGWPA